MELQGVTERLSFIPEVAITLKLRSARCVGLGGRNVLFLASFPQLPKKTAEGSMLVITLTKPNSCFGIAPTGGANIPLEQSLLRLWVYRQSRLQLFFLPLPLAQIEA
jgi:hypothetical protein